MTERPLTGTMRDDGQPLSIAEYEGTGGYGALRKALKQMSPDDVLEEVKKANLRGRGGAGFPTGLKWSAVPGEEDERHPRYFISNSDEMEPGAFKDRLLMEGNPHQLIEGIILGSYAVRADISYIFLRWEYGESARRLKKAVAEAYGQGYLGERILGSGFSLQLYLHISAGRYICGEETALLNALECRRPIPRAKPPFPQISGLYGKPAVVNNAETLSNVPHIVKNGWEWFQKLSRSPDGGTKIYGVSGRVQKPGAWELPMGTSIGEILEEHAGGMKKGYALRGIVPGGASTEFLLKEHLETKMDYDSMMKAGSRLGTGTMLVLDDMTCPVGLIANLERFFARESCGWCTPCREGLPWVEQLLRAIEDGKGSPEDLHILEEHTGLLWLGNTFCAHAPGAMEPLKSGIKYFREDFVRHIREGRCPWK